MPYFQIPRGKDLFTWLPAIAVLAVLAGFLGWSSLKVFERYRGLKTERIKLEEKMRSLEAERLVLEEQIRELESPQGIERLAKEKLGLKNPGEEVVIVVPEERPESSAEIRPGFWAEIKQWAGRLLTILGF